MTRLIKEVVDKREWTKLGILYLGGGGRALYPVGGGGFATGCDASAVPIEEVISSPVANRSALVSTLLKHGAHGSGSGRGNSTLVPLAVAIKERDLGLVEDLVTHGANPCTLTQEGKTPLHEALRIGNSEGEYQQLVSEQTKYYVSNYLERLFYVLRLYLGDKDKIYSYFSLNRNTRVGIQCYNLLRLKCCQMFVVGSDCLGEKDIHTGTVTKY